MHSKELTGVALKVFAIFVAIKALAMLPVALSVAAAWAQANGHEGQWVFWFLGFAALLSLLVLAVLVWKLSNRLVSDVIAQPDSPGEPHGIDQSFLLSLLGIYLTVQGLQQFGLTMSNLMQRLDSHVDLMAQAVAHVASNLLLFLVGLSLVIGPSAWMRMLARLRVAGLKGKG